MEEIGMFFSRSEPYNIEASIQDEFLTLKGFTDYLEEFEMLVLQGFAFCTQEAKGQFREHRGYHILIMNNETFGFVGTLPGNNMKAPSVNDKLSFSKIVKFDKNILTSNIFEGYGKAGKLEYLEASLAVDGKLYEYEKEDKLILSKRGAGNIDMFATYTIFKDGDFSAYIQRNSLSNAARQQAMENTLDERIMQIHKPSEE